VVAAASPTPGGDVSLRLGSGHVEFESPVAASGWTQALRLNGVTTAANSRTLRNALYAAARRIIRDPSYRAQNPAFGQWFQAKVDRNLPAASVGVTCAGRAAEDVAVVGNRFEGVIEAVHVAVSRSATPEDAPEYAGTVRVVGNEALLHLPIELERGRDAIFVGNVRRLTVEGNTLSVVGAGQGESAYQNGIRVHGHLGSRLAIEANVADHSDVGVRVVVLSGQSQPHLWLVRDNVAPAATPAVIAPTSVVVTNNVGA
jgi:hypothetical protein